VDLPLDEQRFREFVWIFKTGPRAWDRHEHLNTVSLNWWAKNRIAEAEEVARRLQVAMSTEWMFVEYPEWQRYHLWLWARFTSDDRAVAFRLAWEPETSVPYV
jgi:hypothetical protein